MLFSSLISSLIFLESKEVGQGMLSQPFVISILLIFLGYDPYYVLLTATATHLFFIHYVPSGASKHPEYPFAFFVVLSSSKSIFLQFENNINMLILFSLVLIVIFSRLSAIYIYFKRKIIEKWTIKLIVNPDETKIKHHLISNLLLSFISGTIFALILIFISHQTFKIYALVIKSHIDINNLLIVIIFGMFIPYLAIKKKLMTSSIGIILLIIFFIIKSQ